MSADGFVYLRALWFLESGNAIRVHPRSLLCVLVSVFPDFQLTAGIGNFGVSGMLYAPPGKKRSAVKSWL